MNRNSTIQQSLNTITISDHRYVTHAIVANVRRLAELEPGIEGQLRRLIRLSVAPIEANSVQQRENRLTELRSLGYQIVPLSAAERTSIANRLQSLRTSQEVQAINRDVLLLPPASVEACCKTP